MLCLPVLIAGLGKSIRMLRCSKALTCTAYIHTYAHPSIHLLPAELQKLETFSSFFQGQQLSKGSVVTLLYRTDATLDVTLSSPKQPADLSTAQASLCIKSASLCRALFETFLGESSVVPEARAVWAAGARQLLASDDVRRDTRRGGSG